MHIDLDHIRATAPRWDFSFTVKGATYSTRPWTLEHSVRFQAGRSREELMSLLADVIEGEPPAAPFDEETLADVIAAIVAYRQELGRKNSDRVAQAVATAATMDNNGLPAPAPAPTPATTPAPSPSATAGAPS